MAEVTDTTGLSVSTEINQGQAQIFKDNTTDQFSMWAKNYYNQNAEKEKLAAQQKREDEKEAVKKFETDYAYTNNTWRPFEDELQKKIAAMKTDLSNAIASGQEYKVGTEAWKKAQQQKSEIEAFAKKGKDLGVEFDNNYKAIKELEKTGLYNTTEMLKDLNRLKEKPLDQVEKFDIEQMSKILDDPRYYDAIAVAKEMQKGVQNIVTENENLIPDSKWKSHVQKTKAEISPFIKMTKDANGNLIPDMSTGKVEIDTENPQFVQWVNKHPMFSKVLDREVASYQAANPNDQTDLATLRTKIAKDIFNPLQTSKLSVTQGDFQDKTLEAARLAQDADQFNRRLAFDREKQGGGAGTDEIADSLIGEYGAVITGQSQKWNNAEVVTDDKGKQFKKLDGRNLAGGGTREDETGIGGIYKDGEGKTYVTYRVKNKTTGKFEEDVNNKVPLSEKDIDLFNATVLNNKEMPKEQKVAIVRRLKELNIVGTVGGADWKKALVGEYKPTDLSDLNLSDYDKLVKFHNKLSTNVNALGAEQKGEYAALRAKYKWIKDEDLAVTEKVEIIKAAKQEQKTTEQTPSTQQKTTTTPPKITDWENPDFYKSGTQGGGTTTPSNKTNTTTTQQPTTKTTVGNTTTPNNKTQAEIVAKQKADALVKQQNEEKLKLAKQEQAKQEIAKQKAIEAEKLAKQKAMEEEKAAKDAQAKTTVETPKDKQYPEWVKSEKDKREYDRITKMDSTDKQNRKEYYAKREKLVAETQNNESDKQSEAEFDKIISIDTEIEKVKKSKTLNSSEKQVKIQQLEKERKQAEQQFNGSTANYSKKLTELNEFDKQNSPSRKKYANIQNAPITESRKIVAQMTDKELDEAIKMVSDEIEVAVWNKNGQGQLNLAKLEEAFAREKNKRIAFKLAEEGNITPSKKVKETFDSLIATMTSQSHRDDDENISITYDPKNMTQEEKDKVSKSDAQYKNSKEREKVGQIIRGLSAEERKELAVIVANKLKKKHSKKLQVILDDLYLNWGE